MAKRVFIWIGCILMAGYLLFAIALNGRNQDKVHVQKLYIKIQDSLNYPYVKARDISRLLQENDIQILNKKLAKVDLGLMEQVVQSHSLVKNAECTLTPSGKLRINIDQRIPVLRVAVAGGDYFFLDEDGKRMNINRRVAVNVPVALVQRPDSQQLAQLFDLACLIRKDDFWNAMIAQIVLEPSGKLILIPRVGDVEVMMGKPENMEFKFKALRTFYQEALPKLGWDRYRSINLEFENQIVCTKK